MNALWQNWLKQLERTLTTRDFDTYFKPLKCEIEGDKLVLQAPNRSVMEKLRRDFLAPMIEMAREQSEGLIQDVEITLDKPLKIRPTVETVVTPTPVVEEETHPSINAGNQPDPRFTFEAFVEGRCNAQAKAAGLRVATQPGRTYNPLFIYGDSGLGKTHLMHAIANSIMKENPKARVIYTNADLWFNEMVTAIRFNRQDEFKSLYRNADVLLIDDIQFLAKKERTQEEFFHTFNALVDARKQVVLTSDRYPHELDNIDDRLKSRFASGLPVSVEPPDLETRVAILLNMAESIQLPLDNDVAEFIAKRVRNNVRELKGALNRLYVSYGVSKQPVTISFVQSYLQDMLVSQESSVSIEAIMRAVAHYYKIRVDDLSSTNKARSLARPRQMAMCLVKDLTHHSYPEIGTAFSKDHTTVLYAFRKINELRIEDVEVGRDYEQLHQALKRESQGG